VDSEQGRSDRAAVSESQLIKPAAVWLSDRFDGDLPTRVSNLAELFVAHRSFFLSQDARAPANRAVEEFDGYLSIPGPVSSD
jgi:hypothetical protein